MKPWRGLVAITTALVVACATARPWTLEVYNNHGTSPVRVRVLVGETSAEWLLQPQQIGVLVLRSTPTDGVLELLDPETCLVVANEAFERAPGILAVVDRGVTGVGPWAISAGADDPISNPTLLASAAPCRT